VRLVKLSDYIHTSGKFEAFLKRAQKRVNEIIDKDEGHDVISKIFDITSVILIMLSVSFVIVETFPIPGTVQTALHIFEIIIAVFFAIEYVLRIWTAPFDYPNLRPDKARMKYIFSFMSLIDLLSIVPVFVSGMSTATGVLKIFKLCKILRLLKASRYLNSIANFGKAIQKKKRQIMMSVIAISVVIIICSMLMYSVEGKEQPEVFKNGFSGVYYCLLIMADGEATVAPITPIGQAISTIMLLLGGCLLGVPIAIVATGFEDMIAEQSGADASGDIYEVLKLYDKLDAQSKERFLHLITLEKEDTPND
jgi:voltage-gated potassium channel